MLARIKDFFLSLFSRKFLLTVSALLTLAAEGEWNQFVAVLATYLGVEGAGDVIDRIKFSRSQGAATVEDLKDEEVDTGVIIPGTEFDEPQTPVADPHD